jgi:hypothetical protein
MNEERITQSPSWRDPRGQLMKTPDELAEMLRLKACGCSTPGGRSISLSAADHCKTRGAQF